MSLGHVIKSSPQTALTLAALEASSRLPPHQNGAGTLSRQLPTRPLPVTLVPIDPADGTAGLFTQYPWQTIVRAASCRIQQKRQQRCSAGAGSCSASVGLCRPQNMAVLVQKRRLRRPIPTFA